MRILALDLAKHKVNYSLTDTQTRHRDHGVIKATPMYVQDLLERLRPDRVVLEIGPSAGWVYDICVSKCIEAQVANPNTEGWRWKNVKCKTDRKDCAKMSDLSEVNQLPLVHMPSPAVRQKRMLIAYRQKLMDRRTAICNSIHAVLTSQGMAARRGKGNWSQANRQQLAQWARPLEQCEVQELWRGELHSELQSLSDVEARVTEVEAKLDALQREDRQVQLVRTIPGVGPRLGEAIVAILDDPHRFRRGKQVSSYAGLVPRLYESGQMSRNGHITHAGNALLRKLLTCVAWLSLRYNPHLRGIFDRICGGRKGRRKVAIVAVARHLLVTAWAMLRDGRQWQPPVPGRQEAAVAVA